MSMSFGFIVVFILPLLLFLVVVPVLFSFWVSSDFYFVAGVGRLASRRGRKYVCSITCQ